jgi:hypothetical protein
LAGTRQLLDSHLVLRGVVTDALLVGRFGGRGDDPIDLFVQISLRARRVTIGIMDDKLRTGDEGRRTKLTVYLADSDVISEARRARATLWLPPELTTNHDRHPPGPS